MRKMNNFETFRGMIEKYLDNNDVKINIISDLHEISLNKSGKQDENYVYDGQYNLEVIDMDNLAKYGYRVVKQLEDINNVVNTADGFLINKQNEWFFIEFKDSEIKASNDKVKNSVLKKAYSNWYMLLDILYTMKDQEEMYQGFEVNNPIQFSKDNIYYILVCSSEKNPNVYKQIKNHEHLNENYTPEFMKRLKDYLFKDAYIYTEYQLEQKFAKVFEY